MRSRVAFLTAVFIAVVACTSASVPGASTGGSSHSSNASPIAAGLVPVMDYAQEFCGGAVSGTCPQGAVPDALRRPLRFPTIDPESPCPVSEANPRIWSRSAPGLGPGPVGPVGLGMHAILWFRRFPGSEWAGQKVLWVAAPSYDGPILIRGERLDAAGGVGFNMGNGPPFAELQLPPGAALNNTGPAGNGWRNWPSYTRVQTPGCYGFQVDGSDFSYTIVFRAEQVM